MTQGLATTPFGRRTMSLGLIATQAQARSVAPEKTVHKWKVFQTLTEARETLHLPDRALAVLSALLSFHPETTMSAGDALIVFPSNEKLSQRAHGMAPATLRRHLAALVEAGIIIRRDSPNGKRYARRGEGGAVSLAFGFELTPLVARAEEFEALAAAVKAKHKALRLVRERITLARRDITKLIMMGLEEGFAGDWERLHAQFLTLSGGIKRAGDLEGLEESAKALEEMAREILNHLELFIKSDEMSASESQGERHKQNSKPESLESEPAFEKDRGTVCLEQEPGGGIARPEATGERASPGTPLPLVLEACPDMLDYLPEGGTRGDAPVRWADFLSAAALVRAMLGISPDAWRDAVETMGAVDASIVVAAILQKGDEVRFPGGYLRALTEKKRAGNFSVSPVLMALMAGKLKGLRASTKPG